MKLSAMSTREAAVKMAALAAPIGNITKNQHIITFFDNRRGKDTPTADMLSSVVGLIPALLVDSYDDVIAVVSILSDKPVEKIDKQPFTQTIKDAKESIDKELLALFR